MGKAQIEVVPLKERKYVGIAVTSPLKDVNGIGEARQQFMDRIGEIQGKVDETTYVCVHYANEVLFTYLYCMEVMDHRSAPDGMIGFEVPANRYVKVQANGDEPYGLIEQFLRDNGMQSHAGSVSFEVFRFGQEESKYQAEILVPLADKPIRDGGRQAMLGKWVAAGSCCEVHEWGEGNRVVKWFHPGISLKGIQAEYNNSIAVWEGGLPAPRPYEMITWEGRPGIVYEKVTGKTLVEQLFANLYAFREMGDELRKCARVLHEIHRTAVPGIVADQKNQLKAIIGRPAEFTEEELTGIHAYIDRLPAKRQLCHGDTNPGNLIIRDTDGKAIMIDWRHASLGNPAADVAEVCVMIEYAILPPDTPAEVVQFFQASRQAAYRVFLGEYCQLSGMTEEEIRAWYVPMAARSSASGALPQEQVANLAAMIRSRLAG
ncbi:hypothetical protein J31TS4_22600 [Paenibacillus sp. J31TS4]|uniref:phosphotransferase n=1 Tax=Paenibacillus sp. J31TS4 TaxID=2807195 RepID=UPI001B05CBA3|nr:phosphotransferase [Paenibacillus sp. J31TS4]GIP38980.1 hypothetical protein J31TS4_22600 [Paenibacillus sp. J31TS4]